MSSKVAAAALLIAPAAFISAPAAHAEAAAVAVAPLATNTEPVELQSVIVTAKIDESLGSDRSASAGVVGGVELGQRPILRQGELLEAVPGMIVTAHTSGGKANQYYLRGFNLDHGTDFSTTVDGAPVNLGSHAHGQGYMDLNWLIPELVAGISYRKGPYYADAGDFSAAGNASIAYLSSLPERFVTAELGTDSYQRLLLAGSADVGPGRLLYAGEYIHYDGPFRTPGNYRRPNGVIKYTVGDAERGGGLSLQAYEGRWTASDQLPEEALATLTGGRFGAIDPSSAGSTHRYALTGEWHWGDGTVTHQVQAYAIQYGLNLFSDFSYFIDQDHGDQFRQFDRRLILGGAAVTTVQSDYLGQETRDAFGFQTRNDTVDLELDHTEQRHLLSRYRRDRAVINQAALWWSNDIRWTGWLQTELGLRLEAFHFRNRGDTAANSGDVSVVRPAPKLGLTLSPNRHLDVYAQAGISYRSNDARGIFDTAPSYEGGPPPTRKSKPLVRSEGAEIGARVKSVGGLTSSVAFWYLQSNSELFFAGDAGANVDSDRPGQRYGVEWNNIYRPFDWLTIDADFAASQAFYTDHNRVVGDRIPEAIKRSASIAATLHDLPAAPGLTASLRLRHFAARDLIEDGSQKSRPSTVVNGRLTYQANARLTFGLEALNLFNVKYNDAEYYDAYRLKGQPANPSSDDGSYLGHVIHAGEPREIRVSVTSKF